MLQSKWIDNISNFKFNCIATSNSQNQLTYSSARNSHKD